LAVSNPVYPWQRAQWDNWLRMLAAGRVPNALLLSGQDGCGMEEFGSALCHSLLCQSEKDRPCGDCKGCRLLASENHPDYLSIVAEKKEIKVAQIRELADFFSLNRHYGQYRVAFIPRADSMNYAAANSLLKTLEEPPDGGVIILICRRLAKLPATIRSRCRKIRFPLPGDEAVEWLAGRLSLETEQARRRLALFGLRPLEASKKAEKGIDREKFHDELAQWLSARAPLSDLSGMGGRGNKQPSPLIQQWLREELQQIVHAAFVHGAFDAASAAPAANPPAHPPVNPPMSPPFESLQRLHGRQVQRCRLADSNSLNPRLLLESGLLEWHKAFSR